MGQKKGEKGMGGGATEEWGWIGWEEKNEREKGVGKGGKREEKGKWGKKRRFWGFP